jgi:DNA polymerase alpha subunit A
LLKRKLSGPCWISLANIQPAQQKSSWCKVEYIVEDPKMVNVMQAQMETPPMVAMSLKVRTIVNPKNKQNEVVMISWLLHRGVNAEGPTSNLDKLERFTLIRRLNGVIWPFDLQATLQSHDLESSVKLCESERELLSYFLTMCQKTDPDFFIGHDIMSFDLDVLVHRFAEFKLLNMWSKIGRIQKKRLPPLRSQKKEFNSSRNEFTAGRLVVDTQQSAQELVHQANYTLKNLSSIYLKETVDEISANDVPQFFNTSKDLLRLVNLSLKDSHLSLKLMDSLLILPLTKQLTCLCGNLWSHSLRSARADRIEHLLLHEFHRRKFIVPEKYRQKKQIIQEEEQQPDTARKDEKTARRKPQYSGGLVLDPKTGLYRHYVLLLDFNSLYPSIIQEYDICFTTKDFSHFDPENTEEELTPVKTPSGVLPKVIANLVHRRRDVKSLMEQTNDPSKKQQLDIKQKALKLVANAMYGCLGFANSRFHCKPLAAMITLQGRTILRKTVDLTETLGFEIIYGDTDSIMVNSRTNDLQQAKQISQTIRKEVNKLYTKLEIGLDGIFQTMLLLKKKKYAALTIVEQNGIVTTKKEVKGLDLVRRDWCKLSKDLGK